MKMGRWLWLFPLLVLVSGGLAGCDSRRPVEQMVHRFVGAQVSGDCDLLSGLLAPDQRPEQPCERPPAKYRLLSGKVDRIFVADAVEGARRVIVFGEFATGATGPGYMRLELEVERWSGHWYVSSGPQYSEH